MTQNETNSVEQQEREALVAEWLTLHALVAQLNWFRFVSLFAQLIG